MKTTGLSGHEIYCLAKKGFSPGNIVIGNSVYSLGLLRGVGTSVKFIMGGELQHVTELIEDGRKAAYKRMVHEADLMNATGITGVSSELIFHTGNIEFLSIGSAIHAIDTNNKAQFTSSANGQELFAQFDVGYNPICFSFGNVAYSLGIGRGVLGLFKSFARGEIKEFSDMFNHTRHLALERLINHAKKHNANAILGIQTTILPFPGFNEMLMIGTASKTMHQAEVNQEVMTSDLSNIEMWNLATLGYIPVRLVLGTSIFSLGIIGSITAAFKSFVRGEINEITKLIYDARENALAIINDEAKKISAEEIVGVKTYVYQLPGGLIEFLAIGTAVKKINKKLTESEQLPPQAIIVDQDTFYTSSNGMNANINSQFQQVNLPAYQNAPLITRSMLVTIFYAIIIIVYIYFKFKF